MDGICLGCSLLMMIMFIFFFSSTNGCVQDSDCGDGRHCCKSHCTSSKIDCKKICFRDQECFRDYLCTQNMCVQCSKRYNCELKSCFNDSDCPPSLRCSTANHMCVKEKPPKQSLTLLPFIIIIAVLGFALFILCYTEGCWREILVYLKRYFGRYGRIARDEQEADQRELCHSDRGSRHGHSNKSTVDLRRIEQAMPNQSLQATRASSNSPNTVRNIQVITHNNETRTTIARPGTPVTSSTSSTCQQHVENDSVNPGCSPALSGSHTITRNPSQLPPNYNSLYSEVDDLEEPPPKYDDVMKHCTSIPVCIEMQAIRPGILTPNRDRDAETTV